MFVHTIIVGSDKTLLGGKSYENMAHMLPKASLGRKLRPNTIGHVLWAVINGDRNLVKAIQILYVEVFALLRVWWNLSAYLNKRGCWMTCNEVLVNE